MIYDETVGAILRKNRFFKTRQDHDGNMYNHV